MEKITGYTPGPWAVSCTGTIHDEDAGFSVVARDGGCIAELNTVLETGHADARLIAQAPEMAQEIARLTADNERLREALESAELSCTQAKLANDIGKKTKARQIEFLLASFERLAKEARAALSHRAAS